MSDLEKAIKEIEDTFPSHDEYKLEITRMGKSEYIAHLMGYDTSRGWCVTHVASQCLPFTDAILDLHRQLTEVGLIQSHE